jgi:hypothetical protein
MKKIFCIGFAIMVVSTGCAQPDHTIVEYLRKSRSVNFEHYIFLPEELIKVCEDSAGRNLFAKKLARYVSNISQGSSESKEKQVLITIVHNAVNKIQVLSTEQKTSQNFLVSSLSPFLVNFKIDESLLVERFTWSESRAETCDIGLSLFVFFCYSPELYIRACETDKDLRKQKLPFPFDCTLENVNIPKAVRKKMRTGILNLLEGQQEPRLLNIANAVKKFDVDDF